MLAVANFIILGLLGGVVNVLLWAKTWRDLTGFESVRYIALGTITGYVYTFLYSEWGYPNAVMCFVAGYMAPDFIQGIVEKLKRKKE